MMFRLSSISGAALAGVCAATVFATTVPAEDATTDIGTLDKEAAEKAFPAKPPFSPYAGAISRLGRTSATLTLTPLSRWADHSDGMGFFPQLIGAL
jgi:hypothetical protein